MRKVILTLGLIFGLLAALGGPLLGLILGLMIWLGRQQARVSVVQGAALASAMAALGLGLGLMLAVVSWRALSGQSGGAFGLRRPGWWLLAFVVVWATGWLTFRAGITPLMPAIHLATGALPALFFLALAVDAARRRGGQVAARPAMGSLAWGGLAGTGIGIVLEATLLLIAGILAAFWLAATNPDLLGRLQSLALQTQGTGGPANLDALAPLITSPLVVAGALGVVGFLVPLIEEIAKSLAVPLVILTGRRLTRLDGFLLGVASGAGFALVEGILNGSLALDAPATWGAAMLVRGGTAAIHCLAAGLAGLGWQVVLSTGRDERGSTPMAGEPTSSLRGDRVPTSSPRRWAEGFGLLSVAVAIHGAWNVAAGVQAFVSIQGIAANGASSPLSLFVTVSVLTFMGILWLGAVLGLVLIPRRLAGRQNGARMQRIGPPDVR